MGRLPAAFAGQIIKDRIPYEFSGELDLVSAQPAIEYPAATFQNTISKVFEIHRWIPRLFAVDAEGVLLATQPDQELLAGLVRISMTDLGLTQPLVKRPTLIGTLLKGSSERTWEWADPHYLPNNAQLQISIEALTFPTIADLASIRVAMVFQGFLLVLGPPQA